MNKKSLLCYSGFPNFFFLYGPGCNLGHNSILYVLECQANYILDCIRKINKKGANTIELKGKVGKEREREGLFQIKTYGLHAVYAGPRKCLVLKHFLGWT